MPAQRRPNEPERPRLLIADDDPVIRSSLSMALQDRFQIVAAADADEAIARAAATQPHAAVVDVAMPKGGGLRAVRGISEVSPRTAVVVLSADEQDALVRDLLAAGAMTYCRKGIWPQELAVVIERSIRAHDIAASDADR